MEEASLEPKKQTEEEKFKKEIGDFFDAYKSGEERFNAFLSAGVGIFIKKGILEKEKTTQELRECSEILNRDEFINKTLIVLEPILEIKKKNPRLIEKIQAEAFLKEGNLIKLNDLLSYGVDENSIHIHLAPSKELLREVGKENYLKLIIEGLKKLAKIVEKDETIKKITAISDVVTNNPKRMAEFGFVVTGYISEQQKNQYFESERRDISEAEISREELLKRYLN
ncbi:MAG: hypothetical protein PHT16_03685 [Candidatus Pacebacteria bacterium]|nr:hypothetical protein [Candidatus Paceibacterota bacterium]